MSPGSAEIRETRGSIQLQLQNWRQAIVDLEFALKTFPEHTGIHQSLASAYEQLGDAELAAKHREHAEKNK